jgi:hypothetical protein
MAALIKAAAAVEAAVRAAGTSGLPSSYPPLPYFVGLINNASSNLVQMLRDLQQEQQQCSEQAAAAAEDLEHLQVRLGLLLLSCLKTLHAADRYPRSSQLFSMQLATATVQVHVVGRELAMLPHSTSNSSSSLHTLLMAREFCATGELLKELAPEVLGTADAAGSAQVLAAGSDGGAADTIRLQCELETCQVIIRNLKDMLPQLPLRDGAVGTSSAAATQTTPALPPASSTPSSSSSSSTAAASSHTTLQALESQRQQLQDSLGGLLRETAAASSSNLELAEQARSVVTRLFTSAAAAAAAAAAVGSATRSAEPAAVAYSAGPMQEAESLVNRIGQLLNTGVMVGVAGTPPSVPLIEQLQMMQQQARLMEQLVQAGAAAKALQAELYAALKGSMREVAPQLLKLGAALCAALPSKICCNNAACTNLAQLSEAELVRGEEWICSK